MQTQTSSGELEAKLSTPTEEQKSEARQEALKWASDVLLEEPHNVLYLDTETTGLPNKDPETAIVSVAIINGSGAPVLVSLVNPHRSIPKEATAVHGITQAMVEGCPDLSTLGPLISRIIESKTVVCYNAAFDIKLLVNQFQKYKIPIPSFTPHCAMEHYAKFVGEWNDKKKQYKWQKLPKLAQGKAHVSLTDCESTRLLVEKMANYVDDTSSQKSAPTPNIIPFPSLSFDSPTSTIVTEGFKVDDDPVPLVLVDFSVLCWDIFRHLEDTQAERSYHPKTLKSAIRAMWAAKINRGPDMLPCGHNYRSVVVHDLRNKASGNYWRGEEISTDSRITNCWKKYLNKRNIDKGKISTDYKGSRPDEKPDLWKQTYSIGTDYVSKFFPCFQESGYEADDWAGELYRIVNRSKKNSVVYRRQKLLLTIDRDWSGLVDKSKNIYWANTRYPNPNEKIQNRLAGELEVIEHTKSKLKETIRSPKELYKVKSVKGEFSDNLPPGAPLEYIDLIKDHPKYTLKKSKNWSAYVTTLSNPKSNTRRDHYDESVRALRKIGLGLPKDLYPLCS